MWQYVLETFGEIRFLETFGENKGLIFGVRFRTRFGNAFWGASYSLFEIFWTLLGASGAPLGDFW